MLDSRGKTKGGWFFILGFNMLKPNMSNTISIGTCSSDLYIHYFFETSGTASCGTTGIQVLLQRLGSISYLLGNRIVPISPKNYSNRSTRLAEKFVASGTVVLLMAEILHHPGCMKPCK